MEIHETTLAKWREQVKLLTEGYRWCSACGEVKITPEMPGYAFKCRECFAKWINSKGQGDMMFVQKEGYLNKATTEGTVKFFMSSEGMTKYCTKCGSDIDHNRLRFSIFISGGKRECSNCYSCSKGLRDALNPDALKKNQVFVPDHYMPYVAEILPNYQMSLKCVM